MIKGPLPRAGKFGRVHREQPKVSNWADASLRHDARTRRRPFLDRKTFGHVGYSCLTTAPILYATRVRRKNEVCCPWSMSLIERSNGQSVFGNVCSNAANAPKNFLAFAETLQMPRKTFWCLQECCKCLEEFFGVCRNAANASKNFLVFAGMLQMPRRTFQRLQHCCKSHEKLSGVCNTVASPTKNFLAFATLLQVPRKTFWRLQHRCKSHEKLSGVCNTVASPTKNFLAFATLLQAFPKTFWPSRGFRRNALLDLCLDPECTSSTHTNRGSVGGDAFYC